MKQFTKRMLAYMLALVMVISCGMGIQSQTVKAAAKKYVKSLSVSSKASLNAGEKKTVKVIVKVSGKADKKVKVKSSNKKIVKASYSSKKSTITLTGVKAGSAKVTVTTKGKNKKGKTIKKTIKVTVNNKDDNSTVTPTAPTKPTTPTPTTPTPSTTTPTASDTTPSQQSAVVKASNLTISDTALELYKGDKAKLMVTVYPDNTADKSVKWSSSNSDVVSVDSEGNIAALKRGTATITVTNPASNVSAKCSVTVKTVATVSSQTELESILAEGADKVELAVSEGAEITIPKGNYDDTTLIISGKKGTVTNNGTFNSVTITAAENYIEAASNKINVTKSSDIKVNKDATASITVDLNEADEKKNVNIDNEGVVAELNILSGADVKLTGDGEGAKPVNVNISSESVKFVTDQEVSVSATAKADLVFTGETENTTVTIDRADNMPSVSGNGYIEVTNSATGEKTVVVAEPSDEMGVLNIKGSVLKAVDKSALEGVDIQLIAASKYNGDTTESTDIKSVASDDEGNYIFEEIPGGNYYLIMKKEGYKDAVQLLAAASKYNSEYVNEPMWMLPSDVADENNASISGVVNDASNKSAVKGITVELRLNKGNIIGEAAFTKTTDENGRYAFEGLSAEQYTIRVLDNRSNTDEKYISKYVNKCVQAGTENTQNVTISRPVKGTGVRFVLSWGDKASGAPSDLDSHLIGPAYVEGEYKMHEVYYNQKIYGEGKTIYSSLDVDETKYSGPETMTIVKPIKGIYYYYVFNWSGTPDLQSSLAQVDVYSGSELLTTYNVPTGTESTGRWWKVCSYNSVTQEIISYNTIEENVVIDGEDYTADVDDEDVGDGFSKCAHGYITGFERAYLDADEINARITYTSPFYDASTQGIKNGNITITTREAWDDISSYVVYETVEGYDFTFYPDDSRTNQVGYIIIKSIETNQEISRYDVFCREPVTVSITENVGKQIYDELYYGLYIYRIEAPTEAEVESWHFTCSDPNVELSLDYYDEEDNEGRLIMKYDDGSEAVIWMSVYPGYYISGASYGEEAVDYYEYTNSISVVIPDAESFDGEQLSFITPDGYSAEYKETQEYDDEDGSSVTERSVVIKDSEGVVVKEKTFYLSSQSDIDW